MSKRKLIYLSSKKLLRKLKIPKTQVTLRKGLGVRDTQYFYSLCVVTTSFLLAGCPFFTSTKPIPKWYGKIYAGDSKQQALVRKQENEVIKTDDPRFDSFVGMSYSDLESFYATYVLGCKVWKQQGEMIRPQDQINLSSPWGPE